MNKRCPICFVSLNSDNFRPLHNDIHKVCDNCITSFLTRNITKCPLCRTDILKEERELLEIYDFISYRSDDTSEINHINDYENNYKKITKETLKIYDFDNSFLNAIESDLPIKYIGTIEKSNILEKLNQRYLQWCMEKK